MKSSSVQWVVNNLLLNCQCAECIKFGLSEYLRINCNFTLFCLFVCFNSLCWTRSLPVNLKQNISESNKTNCFIFVMMHWQHQFVWSMLPSHRESATCRQGWRHGKISWREFFYLLLHLRIKWIILKVYTEKFTQLLQNLMCFHSLTLECKTDWRISGWVLLLIVIIWQSWSGAGIHWYKITSTKDNC